jgi:NitT/TauT family transport system permease protein
MAGFRMNMSATGARVEGGGVDRARVTIIAIRVAVIVGTIVAWQAAVSLGLISEKSVTSPALVTDRLVTMFASGTIWPHLLDTLGATVAALILSALLGSGLGLLLARYHRLEVALDPLLVAIQGIPRVAFGPMIVLFFGVGPGGKIVLATSIVLFIFCANVQEGMRQLDVTLIRQLSLMGAGGRRLFTMAILPSLAPWLWAALDLGLGLSLIGVIIAEFISSTRGLGHLISAASLGFDSVGVVALLIVMMAMIVVLRGVLTVLKAHALPWMARRN